MMFYRPNFPGIFGPSMQRFQDQVQANNAPRRRGGFGRGGLLGGLGMLNPFANARFRGEPLFLQGRLNMQAQNAPAVNPTPYSGLQGFTPEQQQGILQEAFQRGMGPYGSAQSWQNQPQMAAQYGQYWNNPGMQQPGAPQMYAGAGAENTARQKNWLGF